MKKYRIAVLGMCVLFITLGLCGCSNKHKPYDLAVIKYLNDKYNENFEIVNSKAMFNGNDGVYYQAICHSDKYEQEFVTYIYSNSNKKGDKITIDDKEHVIADKYSEVVFSNKIESDLKEIVGDNVLLHAQVLFSDHIVNKQEFNEGMHHCIANAKESFVRVYLVVKEGTDIEEYRHKIENYCYELNPFYTEVFIAETTSDFDVIEKHYKENHFDFYNHLYECEEIKNVTDFARERILHEY